MHGIGSVKRVSAWDDKASASPSLSFLKLWLDHDLAMARVSGKPLAVFVIRIDRYRDMITEWGTDSVEAALATLSSRLKRRFGQTDAFMRSAEDEFTVLRFFSGDPLALHSIARDMLKQIQQPLKVGACDESIAASIGVAFYPEDGNSADLLLERAKAALRRTDRWGGNGFCIHSKVAAKKIAHDLMLREELRQALVNGDVVMGFQPIFNLRTNGMTGVFGAAHWSHAELGSHDMAALVRMAEHTGLIVELNAWLVDRVVEQLIDWQGRGIARPVSLTLSKAQILDPHLARLLSTRLGEAGLRADGLEVVIDQSLLQDATDHRVLTGLNHLADLGIALSLGGVGAGALALQNLGKIPIRSISLAAELIAVIGRCQSTEILISAIIGFACDLGYSVRAADICSKDQLAFLRDAGCDEATGAFFAPALKGDDIDRLIDLKPFLTQQRTCDPMPRHLSMH